MTWKTEQLGSLGNLRNGLNYSKENFGLGLQVISVKDFGSRSVPDLSIVDEINPAGLSYEKSLLKPGDILFVRSNGNKELIGRSMYIDAEYDNLSYSGFCIRFRNASPAVNPRFLAQYFRSPVFRSSLSSLGRGTNINNLNQSTMGRIEVPIPPKAVQDRIVNHIASYDDLIASCERRISLLERAARLLFDEWFVRLKYPSHELAKMVDGLPQGWTRERVGNVAETIGGGTPSTRIAQYWNSEDITWFSPTDITRNGCLVLLKSERKISESGLKNGSARLIPDNSILMTSRASVGFFGIYDEGPYCTNQGFITITPTIPSARFFLLHDLMRRKDEIVGRAGGSTYMEINKTTFRNMTVIVPAEAVRRGFEEFCIDAFKQIRTLTVQSECARDARELTVPRLMEGRVSA